MEQLHAGRRALPSNSQRARRHGCTRGRREAPAGLRGLQGQWVGLSVESACSSGVHVRGFETRGSSLSSWYLHVFANSGFGGAKSRSRNHPTRVHFERIQERTKPEASLSPSDEQCESHALRWHVWALIMLGIVFLVAVAGTLILKCAKRGTRTDPERPGWARVWTADFRLKDASCAVF